MTTTLKRKPAAYFLLCLVFSPGTVQGQTTVCRNDWTVYASPATAISAQIHAEADFIRSAGAATREFAAAREIHARAAALETENSVAYVRAFWDRRAIWESEVDKRRVSPEERTKRTTARIWDQLNNYPELSRHEIVDGTALNFLLNRLASRHVTSWDLVPDAFKSADLKEHLAVPDNLSALRLRQPAIGSRGIVFRAHDGMPLEIHWPSALRVRELSGQRAAFEQARANLFSRAETPDDRDAALAQLQTSYQALVSGFNDYCSREWRHESTQNYRQYLTAKQFLDAIAGQLVQLREIDLTRATPATLRFEGESVVDLVKHMAHRGLVFAPAAPGDEPAYFETFYKLRGLYLLAQQPTERLTTPPDVNTVTQIAAQ